MAEGSWPYQFSTFRNHETSSAIDLSVVFSGPPFAPKGEACILVRYNNSHACIFDRVSA